MLVSLAHPRPKGSGRGFITCAAHFFTQLWSMRLCTLWSARCQGLNSNSRNFLCA
jgi:hypothetical protein